MTGYGRASQTIDGKTYSAEIRALNSKQSDLRLRSNLPLGAYEVQIRKRVLGALRRGKAEMTIDISDETGTSTIRVNKSVLDGLYNQLTYAENTPSANHATGLYAALLRVPGVIDSGSGQLSEQDYDRLITVVDECIGQLNAYRSQEGLALASDLGPRVRAIIALLGKVDQHVEPRVNNVRERMTRHLEEFMGRNNVDKNRYEQEVLFYLEKMDINEEKVRLAQNCEYFLTVLENEDEIKGRKLNFITQEIGREINTLGAKAYSIDIQKLVVEMKDNLEMIKEQLANVA